MSLSDTDGFLTLILSVLADFQAVGVEAVVVWVRHCHSCCTLVLCDLVDYRCHLFYQDAETNMAVIKKSDSIDDLVKVRSGFYYFYLLSCHCCCYCCCHFELKVR